MGKICIRCGEYKELDRFYRHKAMKDGHLNVCILCKRKDSKNYRNTNIEKIRECDRHRPNARQRNENAKQYRRLHKEQVRKTNKRWVINNTKKRKAHELINSLLQKGLIEKPILCEMCHTETPLEAHHPNYDRPLDVIWVCDGCHKKIHVELREVERNKILYIEGATHEQAN